MSNMDYRSPESVPLLTDAAGGQHQRQKAEVKRSKLLTVCPFILGNEFCERLAYYGLATNLVTYLTHIMGVDAAAAAIQVMVFEGTCYITPLLGAYLADSHWGRYKTILVFSTIYLCGCVLLTATSGLPGLTPGPYDDATWVQQAALFGALGVIALGTGGIKPNVSAFGADQFDEKDPQDKREKESFFNWFYLAINIGSLIACTVIVYVQDQVSWTVGFALPASAMASAVLLFLAGSKHYRHVAPTESPMARVVKVVSAALHNRWYNRNNKPAALADSSNVPEPPQQQQQQGKAWGSSNSSSGPSQPLLIGPPAPRPLPPGSSGSSISNSLLASSPGRFMSSSPQRSLAFYQQQQQQQHRVVYGFSPEPSPQQLQAEASGSSGSSLTRPPRPLGSTSPQPLPYQQQQPQQQQWVGGPGLRGPPGGVGQRTGSFSWLESAIVEWQTAQGQLQGSRLQPQQQQQQPQQQGGLSSGLRQQQQQQQQGGAGGYSPQQVEEVKMVLRLLPVFATTVIYWTIYSMMGTFFIQQGSLMDNSIPLPAWLGGSGSSGGCGSSGSSSDAVCLHIPAATMALFNTGAIILLVPLYDAFLEPAIRAAGIKWTLLRRIGWGMVIAVLAMFYAACVERWRLDIYEGMEGGDSSSSTGGGGSSGGYGPSVVPLSIMWQAPAYMLIGGSEVLASIAQLEFFYDQAPDVMRSCSMALQLLSTAVGSYLGGGLVAGVAAATSAAGSPWLPKDLNTGHLDLFLWLCGGLMAANTLLFVLVANGYEYKAVEHVVWVQVPDEEEGAEGVGDSRLPPRAPSPAAPARRAGAAIAINASAARRSQYHYAAREEGEEEGQLYSRSLAFVPPSPALPAPFR